MTPARKSRWFRRWFAGHVEGRLRGMFETTRVAGLKKLRGAVAAGPVVVVCNHVSWWDPMVALVLTERVVPCDSYALMDETNLARLPFLGLIGGFGVDLASPTDGAAAIRHAAKLLDGAGTLVWVFPQGRERASTERPLGFRKGSAEIARVAKAVTVPVALRYEFLGTERAHLLVDVGDAMAPERDVAKGRDTHEARVTEGLDRIDRALRESAWDGFETVYAARVNRVGSLAERVLAWLTRPR